MKNSSQIIEELKKKIKDFKLEGKTLIINKEFFSSADEYIKVRFLDPMPVIIDYYPGMKSEHKVHHNIGDNCPICKALEKCKTLTGDKNEQ